MIELPYRLASRARLLKEEVAQQFAPLVTVINGGLTAAHFSRHAGIRNANKAISRSIFVVQAAADGLASMIVLRMVIPVPPRTDDSAWSLFRLVWHYTRMQPLVGGLLAGPVTGTISSGPFGRTLSTEVVTDQAPDTPMLLTPTAVGAGESIEITMDFNGAEGLPQVVTAWFHAPHVR